MITKSMLSLGLFFTVCNSVFAGGWDTVYVDKYGVQHTLQDSSAFANSISEKMLDRSTDSFEGWDNAGSDFDANILNPLFGGVMGKYPRVQILNTNPFPFSAVGQIEFKTPNGSGATCSGALVGKRHVLTAAHCVFTSKAYNANETNLGWHSDITFAPGRNGFNDSFGKYRAVMALAVDGYTKNNDWQYDFAMIILDRDIGMNLGWFGFGTRSDFSNVQIQVTGYPGDKPSGTQWIASCPIDITRTSTEVIAHQCDQYPGQSGGPSYGIASQNSRIIFGPNIANSNDLPFNFAKRITNPAFDRLSSWLETY